MTLKSVSDKKWNMVAPCGLYCGECTAFLGGKCRGCRSNEGLSRQYRKYCKIYQCSTDKGLKTCIECERFPCIFFDFFKAESLEQSSWFLDVLANMKQIREYGMTNFLGKKGRWMKMRRKCAIKMGIQYCDKCKEWPCEILKRPVLIPVDLEEFKSFMLKHKIE